MNPGSQPRRTGLPVRTEGLVHIYRSEGQDVAALAGVDLVVTAGELVALLGPSGAGKSTLLGLFGGLMRPSAGRIFVGNHNLADLDDGALDALRSTEVGFVLQGAARNLLPYLSARQNVDFAQGAALRKGREVPPADEVLALVGLQADGDDLVGTMTPGDIQLAALAVALAGAPGLILADEPTSQLDDRARDGGLDALLRLHETVGTTVILVTHDPHVAARVPRTVTIRDGRVGAEGGGGGEYAVVAADGSVPLPLEALEVFTPGSPVRIREDDGRWVIEPWPGPTGPSAPATPPTVGQGRGQS